MATERKFAGALCLMACMFLPAATLTKPHKHQDGDKILQLITLRRVSRYYFFDPRDSDGSCRTEREGLARKTAVNFSDDPSKVWLGFIPNVSLIEDCHSICWKSCPCVAYKLIKLTGNIECVIFGGEIEFGEYDGVNPLYVLTPGIGQNNKSSGFGVQEAFRKWWWVWLLPVVLLSSLMFLVGRFCCLEHGPRFNSEDMKNVGENNDVTQRTSQLLKSIVKKLKKNKEGLKLQVFSYEPVLNATNNFSANNMLGKGGFGLVYKGIFPEGVEVAVKRLDGNSGQGAAEFENEVALMANLQHKNLVQLIGYCVHKDEKLLIYEYLPNRSLDIFLFDPSKRMLLDWDKRFKIVEGIAQGLLYLHKHSRPKLIHRDLKASNILLDHDMNPKISDFGLARMFEENKSRAYTERAAGTCGYMPPEYVMQGLFSEKSDVFSFGVIVLEIMSGKKIVNVPSTSGPINLIGQVWDLWRAGKILKLLDKQGSEVCDRDKLQAHIKVALLCIHESANDRPDILDVVSMLKTSYKLLQEPKRPAFCYGA